MKKIAVIISISLCFLSFDLSKSAIKKINKTIASLWEDTVIERSTINLTDNQHQAYAIRKNELQTLNNEGKLVGYLYLSRAASRSDIIDYMIIFKPDLSILNVKVLIYREEYGGEVGSKRWLKQFIGKSNGIEMKFGHDIQNISGATISARSMTKSIEQVSKNIQQLKKQGAL